MTYKGRRLEMRLKFILFVLALVATLASLGCGQTALDGPTILAEDLYFLNKGNMILGQILYDMGSVPMDDDQILDDLSYALNLYLVWNPDEDITTETIEAYDEAIRANPLNAQAWNNKGVVLWNLAKSAVCYEDASCTRNFYEEAIAAYDEAITIDPGYALAWLNKAFAHRDLRENLVQEYPVWCEEAEEESALHESIFLDALSEATRLDPEFLLIEEVPWAQIDERGPPEVATDDVRELAQWAIGATASSERSTGDWSSAQACGEPDTYPFQGDIGTAWAPELEDGGFEWLDLEYEVPVLISRVEIYESLNPGAITGLEIYNQNGERHLAWDGTTQPDAASSITVIQVGAALPSDQIRIILDTETVSGWNEIDAVAIIGSRTSSSESQEALAEASELERHIKDLQDPNSTIRSNAAGSLFELRDSRAVVPLIEALNDPDPEVRANVASALGWIGDERAVEPLIEKLNDEDGVVRGIAAVSLGALGDHRAVGPLIQALDDEDPIVRINAAVSLGMYLKDPSSVEPLIQALEDPDGFTRSRVAFALGELGDPRAIGPLTEALDDEEKDVREEAALALQKLGARPDNAVPPEDKLDAEDEKIFSSTKASSTPVTDEQIGGTSIEATKYGDEVDDTILELEDKSEWVRVYAAQILGDIGDPRAVDPLIQVLLSDESFFVREYAAIALGDIGDPRAVDPLIKALKDEDSLVRSYASTALGNIGDPRAVDPLIEVFNDEYWFIRADAARALGNIGDTRAVDPLNRLASMDEDDRVRSAAQEALEKIQAE